MKRRGAACLLALLVLASCASGNGRLPSSSAGNAPRTEPAAEKEYVKPLANGWVETTGIASIHNITPEEARNKAIMNACAAAIQYYGIQVSQRDLDIQAESSHKTIHDDFLSLTSLTTHGVILEKTVVEEKVISRGDDLQKYVRLRVKIGRQSGGKDPYFTVTAVLNRDVFRVNDTLHITVTATRDCYLTILDITDEEVYVLFPNRYSSDNFLAQGQSFAFPSEGQKATGLTLPAMLPAGKEKDMGVVKVLATKKQASFEGLARQSEYGTLQLALQDLLGVIVKIPLDEMEEVDVPYMITR
jgi:hypothetical protein